MKRYLVFFGNAFYPIGGWADFYSSFDTPEEARKVAIDLVSHRGDWYQVVDSQNGEIIERS